MAKKRSIKVYGQSGYKYREFVGGVLHAEGVLMYFSHIIPILCYNRRAVL